MNPINKKPLSVLLICDFFYPRIGGVEVHIFQLACALLRLGCRVSVLAHHHKDRQGLRIMGNGIKVYFNQLISMHDDTSYPILYGCQKVMREIVIKDEIDIVHLHQGTSVTSLECLLHARTLGLRTVYTDHSLFGFGDLAEVNINKVLRSVFADLDQSISVSNIARDNLVLRSMLNPTKSNVIPNGVDFTKFKPDPELQKKKNSNEITIISVSRQAYRKGTDLLIEIIPEVCKLFPNVKFVIGGDGPKKPLLENMIETSNLKDRVILTGALRHNKVRDIMIKGNIYLNTSLTESFCIAIVEAASTGLYTIATDVGGVGEVLPDNMVKLVNADKDSIIKGIKESIEMYENIKNNTNEFNAVLKDAYNWDKVAHKTVQVYNKAMLVKDRSVITRLKKLLAIGRISGVFQVCLIVLDYLLLIFLTLYQPVWTIKKGKQFKYENYQKYLRNMK
jgi:phosphatidylinositol glycan class A protein